MKPQIKISIAPAPLEQVLTAEFEAKQRKLLAMYHAAPELLDALKHAVGVLLDADRDGEFTIAQAQSIIFKARAAIAKAEGK